MASELNVGGLVTTGNVGIGVTPVATTFPSIQNTSTHNVLSLTGAGLATFANGIAFTQTGTAATGAATTSSTLDHYEEGTWTPAFVSASGHAPTITVTKATYTRVGNLVSVYAYIGWGNDGGGADGFALSGLPFAAPASSYETGAASTRYTNIDGQIVALTLPSSDNIQFYYASSGDRTALTYDNVDSGANNLFVGITYKV